MDPHWNLGYPYGRPSSNAEVPTTNHMRRPETSHSHSHNSLGSSVIAHSGMPNLAAFGGVHPQSFLDPVALVAGQMSPYKTSLPNPSTGRVMSLPSRPILFDPSIALHEPAISRPQEVKGWSLSNFVSPPSHPLGFPPPAHSGTNRTSMHPSSYPAFSDHGTIKPSDPYQVLAHYKESSQQPDRYRQSQEFRHEEIAKLERAQQEQSREVADRIREREKLLRPHAEYTSAHVQTRKYEPEPFSDVRNTKKDFVEIFNQSVQSVSPADSPQHTSMYAEFKQQTSEYPMSNNYQRSVSPMDSTQHVYTERKQQASEYSESHNYHPPVQSLDDPFHQSHDNAVNNESCSYQNTTFTSSSKTTTASLIQQTCNEIDSLNRLGSERILNDGLISKPVPMMQQQVHEVYNQPVIVQPHASAHISSELNSANCLQTQQAPQTGPSASAPIQAAADSTTVKKKKVPTATLR